MICKFERQSVSANNMASAEKKQKSLMAFLSPSSTVSKRTATEAAEGTASNSSPTPAASEI